MDAWYVIQHDRNIWSSMGYRPVSPTPQGGGWTFNPGPFRQGPVIEAWVAEDNSDPMADHHLVVVPAQTPEAPYPGNLPQGHLRLLVKVSETQPGRYRYRYALQNYDFERGIDHFQIPLPPEATVYSSYFGGGPDTDAWHIELTPNGVDFIPPDHQFQPWFTLYNFEIETDVAPGSGQISLGLGQDASLDTLAVSILAPAWQSVFGDRFEDPQE
jgi:hypothetical protein